MNETVNAQVLKNTEPLTINQFVSAQTPGNVGVCLCGGGSRALTAGMGQLRALDYLQTPNGKSLLQQVKAISTVSGGSWVGTTFMYLKPEVQNCDYLNKYVENQNKLTPTAKPGSLPEEQLDYLPPLNIGAQITTKFDIVSLALELLRLHFVDKVELDMVWQTIVGNHILQPYQLFDIDSNYVPTSSFTYNATLRDEIIKNNPALQNEDFALITNTQDTSKSRPAFLICNASMFVTVDGESLQYLAPVQSTSFYTGIVSSPNAVDANNKLVGGGSVSSFAFNSMLTAVNDINVTATQNRQWALADIVGISSAFFAQILQNKIQDWAQNPSLFVTDIHESDSNDAPLNPQATTNNTSFFNKLRNNIEQDLEKAKSDAEADFEKFLNDADIDGSKLLSILDSIQDLIPQYNYWPVKNVTPDTTIKPTRFADAGNLENTGINALLNYSDIDKIISFINSSTPLTSSSFYFNDANNKPIANTNIIVDSQIPPLFGYQPYSEYNKGYILYQGETCSSDNAIFKYNQVFKSEDFPTFLAQLATSAGADLTTNSAIVDMKLEVQDNNWFGIANRGSIQLVLVYTTRVRNWYNLLSPDVKKLIGDFDHPRSFSSFPYYSTITKTQLTAQEINLLANLTAWTVANPSTSKTFINLFS